MVARLIIDLEKLKHNARLLVRHVRSLTQSPRIVAVTKGCLSNPTIAELALAAGFDGIADSRLQNLASLRERLTTTELTLLRQPSVQDCPEAVRLCDRITISSLHAAEALSEAAKRVGKNAGVLIVYECGDGREGVTEEVLERFVGSVSALPRVAVLGVLGNMGCEGGVVPNSKRYASLVAAGRAVARASGGKSCVISGGNSSSMNDILSGDFPAEITEVRLGEALFLGRETVNNSPIPDARVDAFKFEAEILEVADKKIGRKLQRRVVVSLGKGDIGAGAVYPMTEGLSVAMVTSDHLVLVDEEHGLEPGGRVTLAPSYFALLGGMISSSVEKIFIREKGSA